MALPPELAALPPQKRPPDIPLRRVMSLLLVCGLGSLILLGWMLSRPNVLGP